jgi:hypothetical protein
MAPLLRRGVGLLALLTLEVLAGASRTVAQAPASSTAGAVATPEPDPGFTGTLNTWSEPLQAANGLILELVKLGALAIGLAVVTWAVVWFFWRRPHELVIPKLANASGDSEIDKFTESMSHEMRIRLVQELESLRGHMRRHWKRTRRPGAQGGDPGLDALAHSPLPREVSDQRITTLIDSVADAAPDETRQFVRLLHAVTPPRGSRIGITLLRGKGGTGQPGIALEITDLNGEPRGNRQVIWEISPRNVESDAPKSLLDRIEEARAQAMQWLEHQMHRKTNEPPSLAKSYDTLLQPAARWLAFQLTEAELLRPNWRVPPHLKDDHESRVHYFIGNFKAAEGRRGKAYEFFFGEAIEHCRAAIDKCQRAETPWYGPDKCAADTLLERGALLIGRQRAIAPSGDARHTRDFEEALAHFASARRLVNDELTPLLLARARRLIQDGQQEAAEHLIAEEALGEARRLLTDARPLFKHGFTARVAKDHHVPTGKEAELLSARNSIAIGRATAWLLAGGSAFTGLAVAEIGSVERRNLTAELNEVVLYDLAIWYALAFCHEQVHGRPIAIDARPRARRYLVYGLARDCQQGYWHWIGNRDEIQTVARELDSVKSLLREASRRDPELCRKTDSAFKAPLDAVMRTAGWLP